MTYIFDIFELAYQVWDDLTHGIGFAGSVLEFFLYEELDLYFHFAIVSH